jgi:hypothetical protein
MSIENELIERYGEDVLTVQRHYVPPRIAKDKHHLAVIPKQRPRLVKELRRAGSKAHITRHRETKEVTTNLVFTNALPGMAEHARGVLAELPASAIRPLYGARPPRPAPSRPYAPGDTIEIKAGAMAGIKATLKRKASNSTWAIGGDHGLRITIHVNNMIRIDPG